MLHQPNTQNHYAGRPTEDSRFNETELLDLDNKDQTDAHDEDLSEVEVSSHKRKGGQQRNVCHRSCPIRAEHGLSAEEKICDCGCKKKRMGEETSEQLEIIPQQVRVIHHVRCKYHKKGKLPLPASLMCYAFAGVWL